MSRISCCAALLIWSLTPAEADQRPLKYTAMFGAEVHISGIAVDADGNTFIAGTASSAIPVIAGSFQTSYKPGTCVFVFDSPPQMYPCPVAFAGKLNHDGTELLYLTYLGASNSNASGISVDAQGNAWITGVVSSSDLPVTPGALQPTLKGKQSAFVLKLNSTGSRVLFATYLGGSGNSNQPTSQTVDANGNLYVAGYTNSPDFPVSPGAFQTDAAQNASGQTFVTKFDADGILVYSTYFNGGDVSSIAADAAGSAYVTGSTLGGSLPTTPGAFQTSASSRAAFVTKFNPSGSNLLYSTYLAANSDVDGKAIAVDSQGNAYVTGSIQVNTPLLRSSFPVTPGAFQTTTPSVLVQSAGIFSFITKLNADGSALLYSTFLNAYDAGLAVDSSGSVVVAGAPSFFDFPVTPGALSQCNQATLSPGFNSGFILKLAADGSHVLYSTYLGVDGVSFVVVDGAGEVYVSGNNLTTLPVVPGSFGWTGSGPFVAALALVPLPAGSVSCVVNAASQSGQAIAPGEIVDIIGNGIGPSQAILATAANGRFDTSLGGVQVLFNGVPAPLLSAGPNQIRAVVPFETGPALLGWSGSADIQILNGSTTVQPASMPVAAIAPGIFTLGGNPNGQAVMINEDGTLNSEKNPARQGSIVTIYATGLNNTQTPLATGIIAQGADPLIFQSGLQVSSAGFGQGEITYAGAAPGFVAGLTQINFRLPASIFHGYANVYVSLGNSFVGLQNAYFYLQ